MEQQNLSENRPVVLHLSADYPDPHRIRTTTAVERLVKGVPEAEHIVISLRRSSTPVKTHFLDCGKDNGVRLIAYRYFAPPFAFMLAFFMRKIARRVLTFLEREQIRPDIIHAHKLAFEGISGLWLAERFGSKTRLFVSVRGEADKKVLLYKPTYRRLLRRIVERASVIYYVSAWFRPTINQYLTIDASTERLLPNIVSNTSQEVISLPAEPNFVCVLNLDIRRRKGLRDLLEAFAIFHEKHSDVGLDLIGPGSAESVADVENEIRRLKLEQRVRILGPMSGQEIFERLPRYLALALPSYNETFGMVYVEAVFAGIPILYGRGTGIDGYLDDVKVGCGVAPGDISDIARSLEDLYENNSSFRQGVVEAGPVLHRRFDPEMILNTYREDINTCCPTNPEGIHAK